ncbi:MAG: ComEC/Rec2 family competence protein, partial [Patescibacteria group bacterium]|nr:ComEC/Rec2 family competence protein [Patescibacteria group bacterium]
MLHPSRIFAGYLLLFLLASIYFNYHPLYLSYPIYLILCLILLLFFFKIKVIRYGALLLFVIVLSGYRTGDWLRPGSEKKLTEFTGYVAETPVVSARSQRLVVMSERGERFGVTVNQFPEYQFGETLFVSGEILDVRTTKYFSENPGYFLSRGLKYSAFYPEVLEAQDVQIPFWSKVYISVRRPLIGIRQRYEMVIARILPEPEAGLLSGILLGSRADLSDEVTDLLAKVGLIHIIALSGYNITIIANMMRKIGQRLSPKVAYYFSIFGIWAFVFATGLSASVVRAAIMGSLLLLAGKIGRKSSAF